MKSYNNISSTALLALLALPMTLSAATISGSNLGLLSGRMDGGSGQPGFHGKGLVDISVVTGDSYFQTNITQTSSPTPAIPSAISVGGATGKWDIDPVIDYAFYSASATPYAAGSSTRISGVSATNAFQSNQRELTDIFTDGGNFSQKQLSYGNGILSGSLDLTGLNSTIALNVYFVMGGFISSHDLSLAGFNGASEVNPLAEVASAVTNIGPTYGNGTIREAQWLLSSTITDFSDIDTLNYEIDSSAGTITGIIITQVPEPSTSGFLALSFVLTCLRRRRRC